MDKRKYIATALIIAYILSFNVYAKNEDSSVNVDSKILQDMAVVTATTASEAETNNSYATANLLANDTSTYGYISTGTDVDYFKVTFTQNTYVNFWLDVPSGKNYDLYVYDNNQMLKWSSKNAVGLDELLSKKAVTKNQIYYLKVVGSTTSQYSTSLSYIVKARQYTTEEYYGALGWSYPTSGTGSTTITDPFGNTGSRYHKGIDLGVAYQPAFAVQAGKVLHSKIYSGGEKAIALETSSLDPSTDKKIIIRYIHLNSMSVSTGNLVTKGQQIGVTGNTGSGSTGAHLHIDVNNKGMEYPGDYDTFNPILFWSSIFSEVSIQTLTIAPKTNEILYEDEEHSFDMLIVHYVGEEAFYKWFNSNIIEERTITNFKKFFNISDETYDNVMNNK